jgi:hypothetical protein
MPGVVQIVALPASSESPAAAAGQVAALSAARLSIDAQTCVLLVGNPNGLWRLIAALDAREVAYRAHGAALFVGHPAARQLLLTLSAVADRDDGVAEAAALRPPFFGIDTEDVVAALVHKDPAADERRRRVSDARDALAGLRRQRHRLGPGRVVRQLIHQTQLAGVLDRIPNGGQHRAVLAALGAWFEALAWRDDLDFDALAARCRVYARDPSDVELPVSISAGVLQILPLSLGTVVCDQAILWAGGSDALELDGWTLSSDGPDHLTVRFTGTPGSVTVRHRLLVPTTIDPAVARAALAASAVDLAANRIEVAAT